MTRALLKNTFREIANTKARFFSIMAIIALGVGFFSGIKATSPSMYNLAENYYRESRLMDFRLVSTVGFADEDIEAVAALDGVQSVMPSYFCDVVTFAGSGSDVVRIIAMPEAYGDNRVLNDLTINEGRAPKKSGEILTESIAFANVHHKIGSKIKFAPAAGDNELSDLLDIDEFTIVGKAESPLYISYQRGITNIGDGKIDEYMYITAKDFKVSRYTELYVKADYSDKISAFSDEYNEKTKAMQTALENLAKEREAAFTTEVIPKSKSDLAVARGMFTGTKNAVNAQLDSALAAIEAGEAEYNTKIAEAEELLASAEEQIKSGEAQLEEGQSAYDAGISAGREQIAQGEQQLDSAREQYNSGKAALQNEIDSQKKAIESGENTDPSAQIAATLTDAIGSAKLGEAISQIFSGDAQLAAGKSELYTQSIIGQLQLQGGRAQLEAAKEQLESGKAELEAQKASGKEELEDAREEYNSAKAEAEEALADAEKELENGESGIKQLEGLSSTWYVFNRDDNPGYSTYSQNADRLDAVASVFPLFFLLVAVLVCATTMTRLIEEKRTEIATLKALGYGSGSIILKYILYSLIAAVTGSIIGIAIGVMTLPFIIYNAYKIMFYIGDIDLIIHIPSVVLGTLAAVVCTSAVSVIVCAKSLKSKPAQAMRPKAPKPGRRILLEHITPIWKHLGFTAKLTARNLFRYKVRLCMTVIGVAGCTALIVAAFGLMNSFEPLTQEQFGEIFKYDAAVIPRKSGSAEDLKYLKDLAKKTNTVSRSMLALQEDAKVSFGGKSTTESTYISVPENAGDLDEIVSLHTRIGKTPLTMTDDSVLVNEKLASDFGISVGDTIEVSTDDGAAKIKVGGIYEQYIFNYVFMTPECYRSFFGKDAKYNFYEVCLCDKTDKTAEKFSTEMLKDERITAVSFMAENVDDFRNMLNSLDMVVVVMITCAAALAFVVLYNLTNINLAERQREIATFKVLGFFNRETSRFIYIENIILTILGIAAGLGLGVLLSGFIIRTVEVDNVMFGRDIFFTTYLYAAGLTLLFSLLVNVFMSIKIRKVNMVESLKSVE